MNVNVQLNRDIKTEGGNMPDVQTMDALVIVKTETLTEEAFTTVHANEFDQAIVNQKSCMAVSSLVTDQHLSTDMDGPLVTSSVDRLPLEDHKDHMCCEDDEQFASSDLPFHRNLCVLKKRECPHCTAKFVTACSLKRHIKRTHRDIQKPTCISAMPGAGDKPFKCGICSNAYSSFNNLTAHLRLCHVVEASHGGQKFMQLALQPIPSIRKRRRFRCRKCHKSYRVSRGLVQHLQNYHGERRKHKKLSTGIQKVRKPFRCHICSSIFPFLTGLAHHMLTSHGLPVMSLPHPVNIRFSCTQTTQTVDSSICASLTSADSCSLETVKGGYSHDVDALEMYPNETPSNIPHCATNIAMSAREDGDVCSMPVNSDGNVTNCLSNQLCSCSFCGQCFRNSYSLKLHLKVRACKTPYICSECGAQFKKYRPFQAHMRKLQHSAIKATFECRECNRSFTQPGHLARHAMLTHSVRKPYKCHKCEIRFITLTSLEGHLRDQHQKSMREVLDQEVLHARTHRKQYTARKQPLKPLKCAICSSSKHYSYDDLIRHLRVFHVMETLFDGEICVQLVFKPDNSEKRYSCQACRKRYNIFLPFIRHIKDCHGELKQTFSKHYKCHICNKSVDDFMELVWHLSNAHALHAIIQMTPTNAVLDTGLSELPAGCQVNSVNGEDASQSLSEGVPTLLDVHTGILKTDVTTEDAFSVENTSGVGARKMNGFKNFVAAGWSQSVCESTPAVSLETVSPETNLLCEKATKLQNQQEWSPSKSLNSVTETALDEKELPSVCQIQNMNEQQKKKLAADGQPVGDSMSVVPDLNAANIQPLTLPACQQVPTHQLQNVRNTASPNDLSSNAFIQMVQWIPVINIVPLDELSSSNLG